MFEVKIKRNDRLHAVAKKIIQEPGNAILRFEQGNIFKEDGQNDEAAAWWNMAVRFDPNFQPAHEALAEYYAGKGDNERTDYHRQLAEKSAQVTFNKVWLKLLNTDTQAVRAGCQFGPLSLLRSPWSC
jgi:predicted Zn-dependent protease